eukprot:4887672-Pyramimonas_sp.AAC.1
MTVAERVAPLRGRAPSLRAKARARRLVPNIYCNQSRLACVEATPHPQTLLPRRPPRQQSPRQLTR